jgi:hypothetical protein
MRIVARSGQDYDAKIDKESSLLWVHSFAQFNIILPRRMVIGALEGSTQQTIKISIGQTFPFVLDFH